MLTVKNQNGSRQVTEATDTQPLAEKANYLFSRAGDLKAAVVLTSGNPRIKLYPLTGSSVTIWGVDCVEAEIGFLTDSIKFAVKTASGTWQDIKTFS